MTFGVNKSFNGSMEIRDFNADLFRTLCGDMSRCGDGWSVSYVTYDQIRKHRKRRINKKWAKRYGYRKNVVCMSDMRCVTNGNTVTITKGLKR